MKKYICLLLLMFIIGLASPSKSGAATYYTDIPKDFWAKKEIDYLVEKKILTIPKDKKFRPNDEISASEAAIILTKALDLDASSINHDDFRYDEFGNKDFNMKQKGLNEILALSKKYYIHYPFTEYSKGFFRKEYAEHLRNVFGFEGAYYGKFKDATGFDIDILSVLGNGVATLGKDGKFRPYENVTKAEFAAYLARSMNIKLRKQTGTNFSVKPFTYKGYTVSSTLVSTNHVEIKLPKVSKKTKTYIKARMNGLGFNYANSFEKELIIEKNKSQTIDVGLSNGDGIYTIYVENYDQNMNRYSEVAISVKKLSNVKITDTYLAPTDGIESDHLEIKSLANDITKGLTSNYEKSKAIHDWVAKNILYDMKTYQAIKYSNLTQIKPQDAITVLRGKIGVCEGYSNLTAALHRAVGIPAKKISGMVRWKTYDDYSDNDNDVPLENANLYTMNHAWNEVFVDGRWINIDTTWDAGYGDGYEFVQEYSDEYFDSEPKEFQKTHKIIEKNKKSNYNPTIKQGLFKLNGVQISKDDNVNLGLNMFFDSMMFKEYISFRLENKFIKKYNVYYYSRYYSNNPIPVDEFANKTDYLHEIDRSAINNPNHLGSKATSPLENVLESGLEEVSNTDTLYGLVLLYDKNKKPVYYYQECFDLMWTESYTGR